MNQIRKDVLPLANDVGVGCSSVVLREGEGGVMSGQAPGSLGAVLQWSAPGRWLEVVAMLWLSALGQWPEVGRRCG
jgi:hypothetical protein